MPILHYLLLRYAFDAYAFDDATSDIDFHCFRLLLLRHLMPIPFFADVSSAFIFFLRHTPFRLSEVVYRDATRCCFHAIRIYSFRCRWPRYAAATPYMPLR